MSVRLPLFFLIASTAFAQTVVVDPQANISQFLALTDVQAQAISRANRDYSEYAAQKSARMAQVQRDIAQETAKDVLDPGGLGVRYAELEAIRRDLDDQLQRTREKVAAQLTDSQKAKLSTLDDARKLQPLISQAECNNLLLPAPMVFTGGLSGVMIRDPVPSGAFRCLSLVPGPGILPAQP